MSLASIVQGLAFIGAPYLFNDICLIYPLTVGSVLSLREKYDIYLQTLIIDRLFILGLFKSKEIEIEDINIPSPFDYLLQSAMLDGNFLLELRLAFRTFIQEDVTILFDLGQIVIGDPLEKRILDKDNFEAFQKIIRLQNKVVGAEEIPEDESEIAKKFREKRELRDAVKRKQEGASAPLFKDLMSALCVYAIGITPINIKDISIYSFHELSHTSGARERYDIETRFLAGGADPNKLKPKYWITNNDNNN